MYRGSCYLFNSSLRIRSMIARLALLSSAFLALAAPAGAQGIEYTDGTTRYRVAWDFLLAVLAAAAIARVPFRAAISGAAVRRTFSQNR